jgi:cytochrome c
MADSLAFNKIAACLLVTGLLIIGLNQASGAFFPHVEHEKDGYHVDVPEAGTAAVAEEENKGPVDYNLMISSGNIEAGMAVAVKCKQCHSLEAGGAVVQGPPLYGVVGRPIASYPGFKYSAGDNGLASLEGKTWDYEHLDHFLTRPKAYMSGTAMNFVGLKKEKDRADLLAYLRTLTSGEPLPLPPPLPPAAEPAPADAETPPADGAAPAPAEGAAPATPETPAPAPATPAAPN